MVHAVTDSDDFNAKVEAAGNKLVVLDFHAVWCGPCKMIAPVLEELANSLADKIVVLKIDVDECEDLSTRFNISSMPTFVFLKNGEEVEKFSGANKEKLTDIINKLC
ncbi:thioredoxin-2-like [Bradysia coprophila]|uniref:thioredoxin-2-like n=1 Tax=Bradysia coprophila TaxID=38358 RepID=UPI00187DD8D5|nr:thioredoxin-2-like [Bradysia coprophila]